MTMTPILAPLPPCPSWCDHFHCDVRRAGEMSHTGIENVVKLSNGAEYDRDYLSFTLIGDLGREPVVYLSDGDVLATLSIEEAEQAAEILSSLVAQARRQ